MAVIPFVPEDTGLRSVTHLLHAVIPAKAGIQPLGQYGFKRLLLSLLMLIMSTLALIQPAAAQKMPHVAPGTSVGTVNCTTSTCHGSITPWEGSSVLQNEYTTWSRLDKHHRAYAVLLNQRSIKIAERLGLKQPAHQAKICLDCHAHNPAPAQRGARFDMSDGVNCEGCHGPASGWLQSHTTPGRSHAQNVADGMYPTGEPLAQAKLCLSCHFGAESRPMTHRIMGAGHPRLSFEIDTFTAIQPAHWRVDQDYVKRKGNADPVRLWALGQVVAVQELLDTLTDPKRGRDGLFPELVLFDCHACHHPMSQDQYSAKTGVGPGRVRLNDSNLMILRAIVKAVQPDRSAALDAQIKVVNAAVAGNDGAGSDAIAEAKKLNAMLPAITQGFSKHSFSNQDLTKVLSALIAEALQESYADYADAEQAYMAISSLAASLERRGALKSVAAVNKRLGQLRQLLANDEKYQPTAFHQSLSQLRQLI